MKKVIALTTVMMSIAALPAWALDLAGARASGSVCEKGDGYIKKASGGSDVDSLVSEVNAGRKTEYERISKENGQPVDVVAKIAAGKITAKKC